MTDDSIGSTALPAERVSTFFSFRYPQYRLLWISTLTSNTSRWMETVVIAWLVLQMTNSPFLVGLIGACRTAGMLLGPFFGTLADRFDRRRILIAAQIVPLAGAVFIMGLFLTSQLEVWHLFVFVLIGGISYSLDFTARFPLLTDMVKENHLVNALSLLFLTQGVTSGIGPLLGGNLLGLIQASGCFLVIATNYLISLLSLVFMRYSAIKKPVSSESGWKKFTDGLRYVRSDRPILALMLIAAILNFFIPPIALTLIPIYARDILNVGASGLGQLMGAIGMGGLVGSLVAGELGNIKNKGILVIAVAIAWPAVTGIFAGSRIFVLSLVILFFAGAAQWLVWTLIQTLLLQWSSEEMRGRVTGVRAFAIGALPLGNILTGALASVWNAPVVLVFDASVGILTILIIALWATELRQRK